MVEDEELVKALLDNLVESEDWKVAFLLCRLISNSSSLRLSASKYVLKTPLAKEIGRLIYNNIDDFTLMNYVVEFIGRTIPQRKVTVGDPFISRLWGIYDPAMLWKEFPFRAMAGDQKTIEYIKKVANAYVNYHKSEQTRPKTKFMPMVCLNISGKKYSFHDENHIILQVKEQSMFLWYPTTAVNEQSSSCPLELLEIDLASLAKPPATAPLNITLYFEARVHHRQYAAIDTSASWKQLKITLFPPSAEAEDELIAAITAGCALPILSQQKSKKANSKATKTDSGDKNKDKSHHKTVSRSRQLITTKDEKAELVPNPIDDQLVAEESVGSMDQFIDYSPEDVNETVDSHKAKAKRKRTHIDDSQQSPTKKKLVQLPRPQVQKDKRNYTISPSLSQALAASTLPSPESSNPSISFSQPRETLSQNYAREQQPEENYENPVLILDNDDDYYQPSQNLDKPAPVHSQQTFDQKQPTFTPSKLYKNDKTPVHLKPSEQQADTIPPLQPVFNQQPQATSKEQNPSTNQPPNPSHQEISLSDNRKAAKPPFQDAPQSTAFQPQEPVPFPASKKPLFNHSLLHDELEEINNQIYSSLKSGSRQLIKRLHRVQNLLNPDDHSLFLSKYYHTLHEIQTKRQNIKANLTTFVATNKWSPVNI